MQNQHLKNWQASFRKKIKGPFNRAPAPRQVKVDLTAKVFTQKEYLEAIKRAEEKKKKKRHSYQKKFLTMNAMISSALKKLIII